MKMILKLLWPNKFEKHIALEKDISKELMPVAFNKMVRLVLARR